MVFLVPAKGAVQLPAIFGDNMVVEQGEPLNLWGWADVGEKVTVKQGDVVLANTVGAGKDTPWRVKLPAQKPGPVADIEIIGSNTITLTNVLAGEVWLFSGQSNMVKTIKRGSWCGWGGVLDEDKVVASATDSQIRVFREDSRASNEPQSHPSGSWVICSPETAPQFSAVAYFFGVDLRSALKVPVGLVVSSVGGTAAEAWTPVRTLQDDPVFADLQAKAKAFKQELEPKHEADSKALAAWRKEVQAAKAKGEPPPPYPALSTTKEETFALKDWGPVMDPGILYNAKIHSLAPFNIKGFVWYQGESNGRRGDTYADMMTHLVQGWRADWGQPLPFIMVALAGFGKPEVATAGQGSYPLVREASIKVAKVLPSCGVISAVDVGESRNIHPKNKQAVGQRAAEWALQYVYNQPVVGSGPTFDRVDFSAGKAVVHFSGDDQGLTLKGPGGFELAGADQKFVPAQARIDGDTVEVTASGVDHPVALRYAFLNFPDCTVYNGAGLPALPFRTDDWPVVSEPPVPAASPAVAGSHSP